MYRVSQLVVGLDFWLPCLLAILCPNISSLLEDRDTAVPEELWPTRGWLRKACCSNVWDAFSSPLPHAPAGTSDSQLTHTQLLRTN